MAFYERAARSLWAYVYRLTGNAADTDDIVQDAFCRFLRAPASTASEEEARRYVFRIASHLVTDRWRRARREASWLEGHPSDTLAPAPGAADDVLRQFDSLRRRDRALLWLAYVEQYSHADIAVTLGLSRGSVKVLLSRARAKLRALLGATP